MKIIVFDIEIIKEIQSQEDWRKFDELGISVLGAWEGVGMPMRFFDEQSLGECVKYLNTADVLAGFNTRQFDMRVLESTYARTLADRGKSTAALPEIESLKNKPHIDPLYMLIEKLFGKSPDEAKSEHGPQEVFGGGKRLDDIAGLTLGKKKSGDGAHAPVLFKEGKYAELYDYCARDVWLKYQLVQFLLKYGYLFYGQNTAKRVNLYTEVKQIVNGHTKG